MPKRQRERMGIDEMLKISKGGKRPAKKKKKKKVKASKPHTGIRALQIKRALGED